jgi:hypothetical protein
MAGRLPAGQKELPGGKVMEPVKRGENGDTGGGKRVERDLPARTTDI